MLIKPTYKQLQKRIEQLESDLRSARTTERQHDAAGGPPSMDASYERLFKGLVIGVLIVNQNGRIDRANPFALNLLGYTEAELVGTAITDLIHPDDIEAQPLITAKDMQGPKATMTLERHYRCKDGSYIPVEVHLHLFGPDALLTMFQDISRRKGLKEALSKANEALDVFYRSAKAAIVGIDKDKRVIFWNPAAEKMFGWTQQEVLGKPYPIVPTEYKESYDHFFQMVMSGRTFEHLEITRQRKDDSIVHAVCAAGPLHNDKKEVAGLMSIMFDMTERRQAEKALLQSEQRYRSLVENTQDGYFVCELPSGRFRFLNKRMHTMMGYTQDEGLSLNLWDAIATKDHNRLKEMIHNRHKAKGANDTVAIFRAKRKDGSYFRAEISTALVTFDGEPALQGLLRDITEKERLQSQLQQVQRLDSIGTLAGGVAHDFNNLLMAILGNTTLAKIGLDPETQIYEKLDNVITYVKDASGLTKQLLEFARGGKYEVIPTNLNELIEKNTRLFSRTKKEITVESFLLPELWTVAVDRGQIEQVLLNLLVNASQAMPNGGKITINSGNTRMNAVRAKTFSLEPGKYARISVRDTGIGMTKAIQTKIFEPFFTTKDRGRGTGLGLASAYGIIKNHEGMISVQSEPGKGSQFTVYLPAVDAPAVQTTKMLEERLQYGTETILLVDDEEMIIDVGEAMLKELGYKPLTANGGGEAIRIYEQLVDEIDLIILDMIMPDLSGSDTFNHLKAFNPHIKILLSSGYSRSGEADTILKRGCNGFIQKPFNLEDLSNKIREILDGDGSPG